MEPNGSGSFLTPPDPKMAPTNAEMTQKPSISTENEASENATACCSSRFNGWLRAQRMVRDCNELSRTAMVKEARTATVYGDHTTLSEL